MEGVDKQSQVMNQVVLFLVSTKDITTSYTASRGPSIYSMESDPLQMEGTKVHLFEYLLIFPSPNQIGHDRSPKLTMTIEFLSDPFN